MGLLSEGSPLSWEETKKYADHVREHGIEQFISLYHKLKGRTKDCLKWGDEVEYMLVKLDHQKKTARLMLNAGDLLKIVQQEEIDHPDDHPTTWRPEYAAYMIEGTPGKPYGHRMAHFNTVEDNMRLRREEVQKLMKSMDEFPLSLTAFPRLGCPRFTDPELKPTPNEGASRSLFFPDDVIFGGHPRFKTLTRNIRERRGEKVAINIPIFKDVNTPSPFIEDLAALGEVVAEGGVSPALPDHVYMDCMGYGMGCSCLQMTFQACNIDEARYLYDELTPLCPIMLALSAASPVHRGYVTDTDCRWSIIAASVDCRTREERGLEPLSTDRFVINKSRYDSIDSYLSPAGEKYNDIELVMDKKIYQRLRDAGIDHLLAQHIAHLFIRDPISLFSEKIHQDDANDTDHFENIQSTNWQTMRFKPPPPNSSIGWRVEFRPTEVQLTDFENAAFTVFTVLLTRVILSFRLNLVIPISKVDENLKRAQKRDAVLTERFYFRKEVMSCDSPKEAEEICSCKAECNGSAAPPQATPTSQATSPCPPDQCDEIIEMTVREIINGKPGEFPGLVPLINNYLDSMDDVDVDTSCTIRQYLRFISLKASGELKTTARWMRDIIALHPGYGRDSVVTDAVQYDLVKACRDIVLGVPGAGAGLIMPYSNSKTTDNIPSAMRKADSLLDDKMKKL